MKKITVVLLSIAGFLVSGLSLAAEHKQADQVVKDVYAQVLEVVKKDKERLSSDPEFLKSTLEDKFFPKVNKVRMVALLLGKNYWKTTTKAQKKAFSGKFFDFLIYKYGSSIALYDGQKLEFLPVENKGKNSKYAQVFAKIISNDEEQAEKIIKFSLNYSKKYGWRVFDIQYDTTSIVKNFGGSYRAIIAKEGFNALLDKMDHDIKEAQKKPS